MYVVMYVCNNVCMYEGEAIFGNSQNFSPSLSSPLFFFFLCFSFLQRSLQRTKEKLREGHEFLVNESSNEAAWTKISPLSFLFNSFFFFFFLFFFWQAFMAALLPC